MHGHGIQLSLEIVGAVAAVVTALATLIVAMRRR